MPYFAYVPDGYVRRIERIESYVMQDENGVEQEHLGQDFLAGIYPDTKPSDFVMTHYPVNQPDPYPRGKYAAYNDYWDGEMFHGPEPRELP